MYKSLRLGSLQMLLLACMVGFCQQLYAQKRSAGSGVLSKIEVLIQNQNYQEAIHQLRSVVHKYPDAAEAHFLLGRCYEQTPEKDLSLKHLLEAYKLDKNIKPDITYHLAKSYHANLLFDEAESYYELYDKNLTEEVAKKIGVKLLEEKLKVQKNLFECQNAKLYYYNGFNHDIELLNEYVNSIHSEYTPVITADNKTLIFTSRRPGSTGGKMDKDFMHFEDVYSTQRGPSGDWMPPHNLGAPINTPSHDAAIGLSPDGLKLFLYRTNNGGDIYVSEKKGSAWQEPKALPEQINTKFKEPSITISKDGKTIFFSSNKPGGFGGLDIYKATMSDQGVWSDPINLGATINSESDEDAPFLDVDGQTLYFSSNGHNSMGGYDVFMSKITKKNPNWSKPLNLGYPINSPEDDIYFVIAGDHKTAYYASAQKNGYGQKDLYLIKLDSNYIYNPLREVEADERITSFAQVHRKAGDEQSLYTYALEKINNDKKTTQIKTQKIAVPKNIAKTVVKGKVVDSKTKSGLVTTILVKPVNASHIVYEYKTKPDGSFEIALPDGSDYAIDFEKDGYLFASQNIDLLHVRKNQNIVETVEMHKPQKGEKIVMRNVFFEIGDATLDPDSFEELDALYVFLQKNPNIKIELSGHTDNRGSAKINVELSEKRAKVIFRYLTNKGIATDRIRCKGYGSDKPLASNDTEAGRRQNRRTEFEILD